MFVGIGGEYVELLRKIGRDEEADKIQSYVNKMIEKGVKEIWVDGKLISGNLIPLFNDGKEHEVLALMG